MIEKQIENTFKEVFYKMIDETVSSEKPDYDWIVKLYTEIRDRLVSYLKKDSKTYNQVMEDFDIPLFEQMIKNDVFDSMSMLKLVNNTFDWIMRLQAPVRDEYTKEAKKRVLNTPPEKMVSIFIKEVNLCVDFIDEDMQSFKKTLF